MGKIKAFLKWLYNELYPNGFKHNFKQNLKDKAKDEFHARVLGVTYGGALFIKIGQYLWKKKDYLYDLYFKRLKTVILIFFILTIAFFYNMALIPNILILSIECLCIVALMVICIMLPLVLILHFIRTKKKYKCFLHLIVLILPIIIAYNTLIMVLKNGSTGQILALIMD